jgi:uncharacterized protein (TIGR04255 family)
MAADLEHSFPNLPNCPIIEAVIDIRVELPPDTGIEELAVFGDTLSGVFTEPRAERRSLQAEINVSEAGAQMKAPPFTPDGYIFRAPAELLVAQVRLDGFTLSRLAPYHSGDALVQRAKNLWEQYVAISLPTKVTRIAVRNVNRIVTRPGEDIQSVLLTGPEIARALPQSLLNFFMRLTIPDVSGSIATITETFGPQEPTDLSSPIILDIDAFREIDLPPDSPKIWEILDDLRNLKNRIFFNSLTTQALERYR